MRFGRRLLTSRCAAASVVLVAALAVAYLWLVVPTKPGPERPSAVTEALIIEASDTDEHMSQVATGRFSVQLTRAGDAATYDGPQRVPVAQALAWSRVRSQRITIEDANVDHAWSAGTIATAPRRWPSGGIAFHRRRAYEPVTGPHPMAWWVRLTFDREYGPAEKIASELRAPGRCVRVHVVDAGKRPDIDCLVPDAGSTAADTRAAAYADALPHADPKRGLLHVGGSFITGVGYEYRVNAPGALIR